MCKRTYDTALCATLLLAINYCHFLLRMASDIAIRLPGFRLVFLISNECAKCFMRIKGFEKKLTLLKHSETKSYYYIIVVHLDACLQGLVLHSKQYIVLTLMIKWLFGSRLSMNDIESLLASAFICRHESNIATHHLTHSSI